MNKNPIGMFDSGIGGMSVFYEIKKLMPYESIIYLADKKNFPYGDKTPREIKNLSEKNVEWLLSRDCKKIVVACNTSTVNAINHLRNKFPEIDFVGVEPAVKPAAKISKKGILVLSSPKATKSKQLHVLISKFAKSKKVINIGSLELVHAVEERWDYKKVKKTLEKLIPQRVLNQIDTIVLGCTHFSLIKADIQKYVGKDIKVIDSGEAVARRVKEVLKESNLLSSVKKAKYEYFTTDKKETFDRKVFLKANRQ